MRKFIPVLIVATSISALPAYSQGTAEAHLKQADAFFQTNRLGDADRHYQLALREAYSLGQNNPKIPGILTRVGDYYLQRENYSKAEELFRKALEYQKRGLGNKHVDLATNYINLGKVYLAEYKYTQAEDNFNEALKLIEYKLKKDKNIPNFNKRKVNLQLADCLQYLGQCVYNTKGSLAAQTYNERASKIKAYPSRDYY